MSYMKFGNIISRPNRILLRELVVTDFKLRYQGSAIGVLWSVLKPLFLFLILYVVFDKFMGLGRNIEHFPVYLLLGIVLWTFFSEATNQGLQSIVARGDLIRKINFPKYIIVISATVSALINLAINLGVVMVFILLTGVELRLEAILIIPLIVELYVLALAAAFFLTSLNVKFRDVGYLWEIFMQAAFYATPILYPLQMVVSESEFAAKVLLLNPVAQVIQDIRYVLITDESLTLWNMLDVPWLLVPFVLIIFTCVLAAHYFKKNQGRFAEHL